LNVAIRLRARGQGLKGPVIFAEIGNAHHAKHVIANLAVIAAQAGERVLIVDDGDGDDLLHAGSATAVVADLPKPPDPDDESFAGDGANTPPMVDADSIYVWRRSKNQLRRDAKYDKQRDCE
jgi:hypothetical protein